MGFLELRWECRHHSSIRQPSVTAFVFWLGLTFLCIHAYCYSYIIIFLPENNQNQEGIPEIRIASQKFWILSFMTQEQQTNTAFPIFPEATFGCAAHAWKIEICRFALGSALRMHERHEAKKSFSKVSRREYFICKAASQIDHWNQGAICKNILCSRESMVESIDHAPAKLSPAKRRCFQTFKKASHEKWPFVIIDEKGDTCMKFPLLLWNGWTGGQWAWLARTAFSAVQNWQGRLPCDFPGKSGSQIYFINLGIRLLICSWKLYCVLDFGDFCSWKCNFGVGMCAVKQPPDQRV